MSDVRLGDWRDVLPGTYDPARAVVITDPPFGLEGDRGYVDVAPWADHVRAVLELLPAVRHVIRGPATAIIARDYPQPRRVCVEVARYRRRALNRPGTVPYVWHGWAVYGRLRLERHVRTPTSDAVIVRPYADGDRPAGAGHNGLTPWEAALWVVDTWADPGMIVLDPFAGTATIGRAAQAHGFDYLGAEIEARWQADAIRGLASTQLRMDIA